MHSPDALRSISCHRPGVAALPSLTAWLLRHGRHVRSCHLQCWFGNNAARAWEMAACLGALAAARSLQQLNLYFGCMGAALCVTSWCAALRQLSELELVSGVSELCICSSLDGLTAVTQLGLTGTAVVVDGAAQLPPNVERFSLGCGRAALPLQVGPAWSLWQAGGRSHAKHAKNFPYLVLGPLHVSPTLSILLQLSDLTRLSMLVSRGPKHCVRRCARCNQAQLLCCRAVLFLSASLAPNPTRATTDPLLCLPAGDRPNNLPA